MHFRKREFKVTGLVCTLLLFFALIFLCNGALMLSDRKDSSPVSSLKPQADSKEPSSLKSEEESVSEPPESIYEELLSKGYDITAVSPYCPVFVPEGYGAVSEETRRVEWDLASSDGLASLTDKSLSAVNTDIDDLLAEYPVSKLKTPTVLIYHTHTSEGYEEFPSDRFLSDKSGDAATEELSVAAVGRVLKDRLEKKGVRVIHITEVFDSPSRSGSFKRSASAVQKALKNEKDIALVIDLHRGTLLRTGGDRVKPTVLVNGSKAAQISLIACCDENGELSCGDRQEKLALSLALNRELCRISPLLCLPVSLEAQKYNLDLPYPCVMAEIGTDVNTAEEAKLSAAILADGIAALILQS